MNKSQIENLNVDVVYIISMKNSMHNHVANILEFGKNIYIRSLNKWKLRLQPVEDSYQIDSPGNYLYGYLSSNFIDKKSNTFSIPKNITQIKIDIGLSFSAPKSALWLDTLPDRYVFGFEPNPENVKELLSGSGKKRPGKSRVLNKKYINKRFLLFNLAIDNELPSLKTFYMTEEDPGTSSLYYPNTFKLKRIIKVPSIRLADFLSLIPWDRFPFIEHVKVDAQGNDLRILQSAGRYLSQRIVYVTAETQALNQYSYSHSEKELDSFMKRSGFVPLAETDFEGNKTYLNKKFKQFTKGLDCSTLSRSPER